MKRLYIRIFAVLLAAVASIYVAGCSAAKNTADATQVEPGYGGTSKGSAGGNSAVETGAPPRDENYSYISDKSLTVDDTRKIIKTVTLYLETKDFDSAIDEITSITAAAGGYIESSYVTGKSYNDYGNVTRNATFTLRVPAEGLDAYVNKLSDSFNVLSRQESSADITDTYFDSKARLDSLLTQEERLLSMLENADDLEYMLKLEDKLSEVRYQIENLNSMLQRYDKSVSMATINVTLQEVVEYQKITEAPKTFGERLYNSFVESWTDFAKGLQDFAVGLVYALPTLLVLAVIVAVIVILVVSLSKRQNRRRTHNSGGGDEAK